MTPHVRNLELWNSPAAVAIYNDAVADKLATFDEAPTSVRDFKDGLRESVESYPAIAVENDSKLVAYAASSPHLSYAPIAVSRNFQSMMPSY